MAEAESRRPLIVEIKRNALDDGPGIRTTVFFKGCPLACLWCQNPEAIKPYPQIIYSPGDCLLCGACEAVCPRAAIDLDRRPRPVDRSLCRRCGQCAARCPSKGIRLVGRFYSAAELAEIVSEDLTFYENSGGGVTLSGGEPTLFPRYLEPFLQAITFKHIHVNLETCGYYGRRLFEKYVLPYLDLIYFDLKLIDPAAHRRYTGRSNDRILENFRALIRGGSTPVLPRIPLIPGITDRSENLAGIAAFLKGLGLKKAALLPYNPLWLPKAEGLGRDSSYHCEELMTPAELERCAAHFDAFELERVGGT